MASHLMLCAIDSTRWSIVMDWHLIFGALRKFDTIALPHECLPLLAIFSTL